MRSRRALLIAAAGVLWACTPGAADNPTTAGSEASTPAKSDASPSAGTDQAGSDPASEPEPSDLSSEQAQPVLDRVVTTKRFIGLDESEEYADDELDDGEACNQAVPSASERVVSEFHLFGTEALPPDEGFAEVHQTTIVYRTADAAKDGLAQVFDALEECERIEDEDSGQVKEGYERASVPGNVALDARAVKATMTTVSGDTFVYRHGCLQRGPVRQCVTVYSVTESTNERWFNEGFIDTSQRLSEAADDE